jgi:hypothetical protein
MNRLRREDGLPCLLGEAMRKNEQEEGEEKEEKEEKDEDIVYEEAEEGEDKDEEV